MRTEWRYVTLAPAANGLTITLNDAGRQELADLRDTHPEWTDTDYFRELVEDMLCNGWDALAPEEIGALTGCPVILSPDCLRDDLGRVASADPIYWHERYQLDLACESLERGGLFLQLAS